MNWYIAICSLVTGFVLGLFTSRWQDMDAVKREQRQLIDAYVNSIKIYNRNFGRLFDINREILKTHLSRTDYDYAMQRIEALEPVDALEEIAP